MTMIQRRALLGVAAGGAAGLLGACGGGGDADAGTTDTALAATPDQQALAVQSADALPRNSRPFAGNAAASARYRFGQRYLFQTVPTRLLKSRLPDGRDLLVDIYGPTHRYVDFQTGWPWTRPGGDWIDASLVRHGSVPWFSAPVAATIGGAAIARYSVDVTKAVAHCQVNKRWCALLLTAAGAERVIAGTIHPTEPAPYLIVTYQGGSQARLNCRIVAANTTSSTGPFTAGAQVALPAFTEFEPPAGVVTKAVLYVSVTQHWSGTNPRLLGYVIDPPVNSMPVQPGLAATAGLLDAGLEANPQIIGVHRYLDGTTLADFALALPINFGAERNFDPAIYGTGATDLTKLPHLGLGKWVNAGSDMEVVGSRHAGEGFEPLAPGLGALRLTMPAAPGITDGSVVGNDGTLAGNAMIYLPEKLFGRLPRLFVRYYVRIGSPAVATRAKRRHVYHRPGETVWTTNAGKFGICADHSTSYGGNSGTSGGGNGWQMRHAWYDCESEAGGPDEGGWAPGFHMYDFYRNNPPGYNYGKSDNTREQDQWGQQGGLGGMFYAGRWYCVETEVKLNSLSASVPGYVADGALRTWVDGRLAYVRTGMVFRTAPVKTFAYNPDHLRPCREPGVRGLWLNWFHGGQTQNTMDRSLFYTGLAWSQAYIGPMRM